MNYLANGIPPGGQDPGSSETMNALMAWIQRQQAAAGAKAAVPSAGMGAVYPAGSEGDLSLWAGAGTGAADALGSAAAAGGTEAAIAGEAAAAGSSY